MQSLYCLETTDKEQSRVLPGMKAKWEVVNKL